MRRKRDSESPLILVVDDNPVNRLVASQTIAGIGYNVVEAADAETALALITEKNIALVFMDVQMPVMDGLEATHRIRIAEKGTGRHLLILGLTVHDLPEDRAAGLESGMDDYLVKPVTYSVLKAALARWLPLDTFPSMPRLASTAKPPPKPPPSA